VRQINRRSWTIYSTLPRDPWKVGIEARRHRDDSGGGGLRELRPALLIQADVFNDIHGSITVVPLTSTIIDAPLFRITLDPSRQNGLNRVSQIMVDKVVTLPREKIGKRVGHLGKTLMIRVGRALCVWLGMS
jgi:mRNA interferase MazF